jgi:hypothetical protein
MKTMPRIDELGGDSSVKNLTYRTGSVYLHFTDGDSGESYHIEVSTPLIFSETDHEEGSVHVRLISIADLLSVDPSSGRYVLGGAAAAQMKVAREGYQWAVGLKASEYPLLLQIRGYRIVLSCPIRSIEDVRVLPEE